MGAIAGSTVSGSGVSGSKPTTVTMQQLQQVIRQVTAGNAQVLVSSPSSGGIASGSSATALLTKAPQGQTVQARVIPVSQQGLKQTIQVVTTGQPRSCRRYRRRCKVDSRCRLQFGPVPILPVAPPRGY